MIVAAKTDARTASQVPVRKKSSVAEKQTTERKVSSAKTAPKKATPSTSNMAETGAAKAVATPKAAPTKTANRKSTGSLKLAPERRHQMICDEAYYRAERRGFMGGDPLQDWLEAEAEVDSRLNATSEN
jgi:hypothetical protein